MYKSKEINLHLHMFDGAEGGAGAGEGGPGTGAPGAEDLAEPRVEYGRAEAGSDGDNEPDAPENGNQGSDLDAEFEELINGKYKEQFGGRVNSIMQNRFKNSQDYQAQVGEWSDATAILAAKYGIDNTPEALKTAIENDDGMFSEAAEAEGLTAEKYRENLRLKMEAQAGRTLQEHMEAEAEKQARFDQWDAEAEELKGVFPAFDLDAELENEVFTQSLDRGNSVRDSFMLAHMDEILAGNQRQAQQQATQKMMNNINARGQRPAENGAVHQPAVIRKTDPSKFTDADMDEIARRVRAGERIPL